MNEELIKRAENAIGIMEDSSNTTADEDYLCEIIRELLAALSQPADGWRPISEAARIHGHRFLAWDIDLGEYVAEWYIDRFVFTWNQEPCNPTYFMPLLQPPKGE